MGGERGSALIIALLVTFILSLLGVSFLVMARTEGSIAQNERLGLQTLYMAEAGARVVRGWFDRPGTALAFPPPAVIDRSQRLILDANDPYGNPPFGSSPLYKQGIDLDALNGDDLFERPYRGDLPHALMGLAEGPDMRIDDENAAARVFLQDLSATLLGANAVEGGRIARISRIDVYAPPYALAGSTWSRLGIGTIAVTARLYRTDPAGQEVDVLAQQTVAWVLNEIPYKTPVFGPLHTCGDLELLGDPQVRWGTITVLGDVLGYDEADPAFPPSVPRDRPPGPRIDRLWTSNAACVQEYNEQVSSLEAVVDPWLRVIAADEIGTLADTCITSLPSGGCPTDPPASWSCCDHCNIQPSHPLVGCPAYDYEFWKNVATSGARNVYYLVPAGPGSPLFLENGREPALSFAQVTTGRQGLFFFDTVDGNPPHDDDDDGEFDNLSAPLQADGTWNSAGYIFLNAERLTLADLDDSGPAFPVHAPGEPYDDADGDQVYDAGEPWINLEYPATLGGPFHVDAADGLQDDGSMLTPVRNARGPAIATPLSFRGILYTTGRVTASGAGTLYGSVIARGGVTVESGGPSIYWARELAEDWPPVDLDLPRVTVTRWTELR